ncbi:hypothetical protein JST97_15680 [bacterium]|nr:hypothetical protein [bacterium]
MIYLLYALVAPSLPLAWPLPPVDLLLLLESTCQERWTHRLISMVWIDVALGQPGIWWRWPLWCLWIWLCLGRLEWLRQPVIQLSSGAAMGLLWYWALGPAFSWLGAIAVALQAAGLLWWWLPAPQRVLKSWGWHRP